VTSYYPPPLWLCRVFCNETLKGAELSKTKVVCFGFFCNSQRHKHAQFCDYFWSISTRRESGGRYVLAQIPHIKFHENSPSGSSFVLCGRTDSRDEANGRFSQICEGASSELSTRCSSRMAQTMANAHYKHSKLLQWRLTAVGACFAVREGNYDVWGHRK